MTLPPEGHLVGVAIVQVALALLVELLRADVLIGARVDVVRDERPVVVLVGRDELLKVGLARGRVSNILNELQRAARP